MFNHHKHLTHPVSPHHEIAETNVVVETDLTGRHSSCSQHLLRQLYVGDRLQSLVVVSELCVETKETDKTEVAKVLVERVAAKVSCNCRWIFTSVVGLKLCVCLCVCERERIWSECELV